MNVDNRRVVIMRTIYKDDSGKLTFEYAPENTFSVVNSRRFVSDEERRLAAELSSIEAEEKALKLLLEASTKAANEKEKEMRLAEHKAYEERGFRSGEERVIWVDLVSNLVRSALVIEVNETTIKTLALDGDGWLHKNDERVYVFSRVTGRCVSEIFRDQETSHSGYLSKEDTKRFLTEWIGDKFYAVRLVKDGNTLYVNKSESSKTFSLQDHTMFLHHYSDELSAQRSACRIHECREAIKNGYRLEFVVARETGTHEIVIFSVLDKLVEALNE